MVGGAKTQNSVGVSTPLTQEFLRCPAQTGRAAGRFERNRARIKWRHLS